jgi:hypothetical protein
MRNRRVWNRLDFLDLEDAQGGEPAMKSKEWIVIGTGVLGRALCGGRAIEHSAPRHAIDVRRFDAEADDTAGKYVHDQHHPMAVQEDRFAAEEIDAPKAICRLGDERQPGGTCGAGVVGR